MKQQLLTLYEDRRKQFKLSLEEKNALLAMRSAVKGMRLELSWDGYLHVRHHVGFVSYGRTRLQILPKIYEETGLDTEEERCQSMRVLMSLLRASKFGKVLSLPEQNSMADVGDILEILVAVFAQKIIQVYSRQMNREYLTISENSGFIKGRIDFAANMKANPYRRDRHVVCFESFEHDNTVNNIIKSVCIRLIRLTTSPDNKKELKKALVFLDDAREVSLTKELFDSVRFTRLNMPFEDVFEMAKMFFMNLSPLSYRGNDTICSFLVPLNELFEFYLYKVFKNFGNDIHAAYQKEQCFAKSIKGGYIRKIKPDFVLEKEGRPMLIVDAKYKNPGYYNGQFQEINQADMYQVFAYARVFGVQDVALIYPQFTKEPPKPMVLSLKDHDVDIRLTIACVNIVEVKDKDDFEEVCEALREVLPRNDRSPAFSTLAGR